LESVENIGVEKYWECIGVMCKRLHLGKVYAQANQQAQPLNLITRMHFLPLGIQNLLLKLFRQFKLTGIVIDCNHVFYVMFATFTKLQKKTVRASITLHHKKPTKRTKVDSHLEH